MQRLSLFSASVTIPKNSQLLPAKLRELLGGQSGVIAGSLQPHPAAQSVEGYRSYDDANDEPGIPRGRPDRDFFAEGTPFKVHAKLSAYTL